VTFLRRVQQVTSPGTFPRLIGWSAGRKRLNKKLNSGGVYDSDITNADPNPSVLQRESHTRSWYPQRWPSSFEEKLFAINFWIWHWLACFNTVTSRCLAIHVNEIQNAINDICHLGTSTKSVTMADRCEETKFWESTFSTQCFKSSKLQIPRKT